MKEKKEWKDTKMKGYKNERVYERKDTKIKEHRNARM